MAPLCSCSPVLCSQVIRSLLYFLVFTFTLYPSFCCQISLMFCIFSPTSPFTCYVDFLAVFLGNHSSSEHSKSPWIDTIPAMTFWCWDTLACLEAWDCQASRLGCSFCSEAEGLDLNIGWYFQKTHSPSWSLVYPDKILIIFKTSYLHFRIWSLLLLE